MTPRKYAFIDALRGIAFLGVFACHIGQRGPGVNQHLAALLDNGDKGVQLFFLLSALTLFLSLDGRKGTTTRPTLDFFLRRFFRIAPLFYLGILVYGVVFPFLRRPPVAPPLAATMATLCFAHGWNPYWINHVVPGGWSIAVEMNFYLLVPWLHRRLTTLGRALGFALGAGALAIGCHFLGGWVLGRTTLSPTVRLAFLRWWLPNQLPAFALGFVLYHVLRQRGVRREAADFPRAVVGVVGALGLYAGLVLVGVGAGSPLEIPLYGGALFLFVYALALYPLRVFVNPLCCHVGKVSFSCYLVHFAVLKAADAALPAWGWPEARLVVLALAALAATVGLATLTYRIIEMPGQALGTRLIAWAERTRNTHRHEFEPVGAVRGRKKVLEAVRSESNEGAGW